MIFSLTFFEKPLNISCSEKKLNNWSDDKEPYPLFLFVLNNLENAFLRISASRALLCLSFSSQVNLKKLRFPSLLGEN